MRIHRTGRGDDGQIARAGLIENAFEAAVEPTDLRFGGVGHVVQTLEQGSPDRTGGGIVDGAPVGIAAGGQRQPDQ